MNEACLTSWLLNQAPVYWAAVDPSRRCPTHHFSLVLHLSHLDRYSHGEGGGNGHSRRSSPPPALFLLLDLSVLLLRQPGHPLISQRIIQTRRKPQPTRVSPSSCAASALQLAPEAGVCFALALSPQARYFGKWVYSLAVQLPRSEPNGNTSL